MTDEIYCGRLTVPMTRKIIRHGILNDYEFVITTLGSHPCAYVIVNENHPLYQKDLVGELGIVHGDVTYSEAVLTQIVELKDKKWVIGWDYCHAFDYFCIDKDNEYMNMQGKKWSVSEILKDVQLMVDYLIEIKKAPPTP